MRIVHVFSFCHQKFSLLDKDYKEFLFLSTKALISWHYVSQSKSSSVFWSHFFCIKAHRSRNPWCWADQTHFIGFSYRDGSQLLHNFYILFLPFVTFYILFLAFAAYLNCRNPLISNELHEIEYIWLSIWNRHIFVLVGVSVWVALWCSG